MFKQFDCFRLTKPIPNEPLAASVGSVGVVLEVWLDSYEVEFVDANGVNIGYPATFILTEDYMEPK
jgi:hypothetical protein